MKKIIGLAAMALLCSSGVAVAKPKDKDPKPTPTPSPAPAPTPTPTPAPNNKNNGSSVSLVAGIPGLLKISRSVVVDTVAGPLELKTGTTTTVAVNDFVEFTSRDKSASR